MMQVEYNITHVFSPMRIPDAGHHAIHKDYALAGAACAASTAFSKHVTGAEKSRWGNITKMLASLRETVQAESFSTDKVILQLKKLKTGGILAYLLRAQNAAVVFRKLDAVTLYEAMEISPTADAVMGAQGKLQCSYPGPAIEVPNRVFGHEAFQAELANFLVRMNEDILHPPSSIQPTAIKEQDTCDPQYVTELLTGILRAVGRPADIPRITKRIGDDVVRSRTKSLWRRSSLWLLIRVALQTSAERSSDLGRCTYKKFLLFFMCRLAEQAVHHDLSNDLLHTISTKISRRLRKLSSSESAPVPDWLSKAVSDACERIRSTLRTRWTQVQRMQYKSPRWRPSTLDLAEDVRVSIPHSCEYIHNSLQHINNPLAKTPFEPSHHPRATLDDFLDPDGSFFNRAYQADRYVALYDVEKAVEHEIDDWIERAMDTDAACEKLELLANGYSSNAQKAYAGDPESISIMLLTTIELWIALDTLVLGKIPLFAEYSPEVPITLLEALLLRSPINLERVRRAFHHLSRRHSQSHNLWSTFSGEISQDSFAVRYYGGSQHLQGLRAQIEADARHQVDQKKAELTLAVHRRAETQQRADLLNHVFPSTRSHTRSQCRKCQLEKELEDMRIEVHEWPLPTSPLEAAVVVFELDCPVAFNMWRSTTLFILVNLCSPPPEHRKRPSLYLHQYSALEPYMVRHPRSRVTLGSDVKPINNTRHAHADRSKPVPSKADLQLVCVKNNLAFYGYDEGASIPTSYLALCNIDLHEICTYQLPDGAYQNLQIYVDATSHASNEVMANQSDCHKDISPHEYIALGHLRSGGQLQWLNILRELRARTLSFHHPEIHFLLAQTASQVGPFTAAGALVWHQTTQDPSFCSALLSELESLVRDVEANWLEGPTMGTTALLLTCVLASSPNQDISDRVIRLLHSVRQKTYGWVEELSHKVASTSATEADHHLLRDTAAICRSTFDVGPTSIQTLLGSASDSDVEALIVCSILVHKNTPAKLSTLPLYSQLLLSRDRYLSLALEGSLGHFIQAHGSNEGINNAVGKVWLGYRVGSEWEPLPPPNARWFWCATRPTATQRSQVVHLNVLNGALLVDGKPLSGLPPQILRNPIYCLLFGERLLEVTASDLPGMTFSTKGMIEQHQVHFALRGKDLVIQARHEDLADVLELIPQEKLGQDLPAVLINDHVHWLNLTTWTMEIRPLNKLWMSSSQNWQLDFAPGNHRIWRGRERLVDIRSNTWAMLSCLVKPLDDPQNLLVVVTLNTSPDGVRSRQLSVTLPRYSLSFFVNEDGELQSRNLRGMVYDMDQSIGTLFGLINQLVLRPKCQLEMDLIPRCILIPDGDASFKMHEHHVQVEIDVHSPPHRPVTYQTYRIDSELGCLTGNVGLTNKLFQAYLHALTSSGCNPDPLTGRTGTEEALTLLSSAGCRSIMKVDARDAKLLRSIASLCPSRNIHPQHLGQNVHWQSLPETSQHHQLYTVVTEIKNHCERVQLFNQNSKPKLFEGFPSRNPGLFKRSALRASYLLPLESSKDPPGADHDVQYHSRGDTVDPSRQEREQRAYAAAWAVYHKSARTIDGPQILRVMESWTKVVQAMAPLSLSYNKSWLTPDLSSIWIEAYNQLRKAEGAKQHQLLFSLPAMAYRSPELSNLISPLVAFTTCRAFLLENPPPYDSYEFSKGYEPSSEVLTKFLKDELRTAALPFDQSPECSIPAKPRESLRDLKNRRTVSYDRRIVSDANAAVEKLRNSLPTQCPPALVASSLRPGLYNLAMLNTKLELFFSVYHWNHQLRDHANHVQSILDDAYAQGATAPGPSQVHKNPMNIPPRGSWSITAEQLFNRPAHLLPPAGVGAPPSSRSTHGEVEDISSSGSTPVGQLAVMVHAKATNPFQHQYAADLQGSIGHFQRDSIPGMVVNEATERLSTETLRNQYWESRNQYLKTLESIMQMLGPSPAGTNRGDDALANSGQWPRITPNSLFRRLASTSLFKLPQVWRENIITLATYALKLQRSRRLLCFHLDNLQEEFMTELEHQGLFNGWEPGRYSDWLLLQLQGNFLVRHIQVDVAIQMMSPQSDENTTMQLNMGEGKSSVIVPITVAALADGNQMVRVIVPKALTAQMFQLLVDRLGGLVNRRIYYLPFSRSLGLDAEQAVSLHAIMVDCMRDRGVLLVQPEHVLSLKLVSVEKQLSEPADSPLARHLLKLQRWMKARVRDVLDESDEILHVRYQLVYTLGFQQPMEGFPERWTTTQQVLGLVKKYASSLRDIFPLGVEYECGLSGSFPHFRILQVEAGQMLVTRIVQDMMASILPSFKFEHLPAELKDAISIFISSKDVADSVFKKVEGYAQNSALWGGLLLLRGLFATDILLFAFKEQRWRVDYGLAPERTMLAVPYRAKDVPAQRAEFGHPDVAILLTCLSYYYGGLNEEQLGVCFDLLLKQDDPSLDYDLWVQGCPSVPDFLRNFSGINIKSTEQWKMLLLPLFSHNQATIDFYLSRVVFPKEAKEFPSKLSCSGWDLAEKKEQLTTGFSGTNDGRYLLPVTITQHDPEHQRGTNAKVLSYLLQPENDLYRLTTHGNGERRTTREFLEMVVAQTPEIRVLLDVGAQMLDLQNRQLAETWLELSPDVLAAIYFNNEDELIVLTRDGRTQLLLSSPFAQQLDQCVVYLDDAHTRGTDIKFPRGFRAAVTLGPKVTKDRLAQGCMRMRKLGHGHSVMFYAPLEIDRNIRLVTGKGPRDIINAGDVLHWAIRETCNEVERWAPQWAQQGVHHTSRYHAWSLFCEGSVTREGLKGEWLQEEAKALVNLYSPRNAFDPTTLTVPAIRERCESLGIASLRNVNLDEEQEREVVYEVERERQVEKPPKLSPVTHSVHHDVLSFVKTGVIPTRTQGFLPFTQTLSTTSAALTEPHVWSRFVWATKDFCTTVTAGTVGKMDDYLRPVQWVVSGKQGDNDLLVILSPYEVDRLLPDIKISEHVRLHLYIPRTIKSMQPCDDLKLYSIPATPLDWTTPWALIDQLNVFAGQLYLRDRAAYLRLCRFLCVYANDPEGGEHDVEIASDGFIAPENRPPYMEARGNFQSSPLPFLRVLTGLRRKGMGFPMTHMWKVLDGRLLTQRDLSQ